MLRGIVVILLMVAVVVGLNMIFGEEAKLQQDQEAVVVETVETGNAVGAAAPANPTP